MKKAFLTLAFLISSVAFAAKKEVLPVKIEIVAESDGFQGRYNAGGWTGRIAGTRTFTSATTTKAIINGDHTLLSCEEHHSSCIVLGAGTYDAEIKIAGSSCSPTLFHSCGAPDVWINYVRPIDHKVFRQHWKVAGSW